MNAWTKVRLYLYNLFCAVTAGFRFGQPSGTIVDSNVERQVNRATQKGFKT